MKKAALILLTLAYEGKAGPIFGEDFEVPPIDEPIEITQPSKPLPADNRDLKRVPWTTAGGGFLIDAIGQFCRNGGKTTCESVRPNSGQIDTGVKVYKNGQYLFTFDRAIAEEVQQDFGASQTKAEEHHPYSMYIARKEAEKSNLEYWAIACASGFGPYCGGVAAKFKKFEHIILVGCTSGLAICQKYIKDEQAKIQKEIDRVLAACKISDQACFDAITGGGETQARAQSQQERQSGARPPHTPSRAGYRPMFLPGGDASVTWDSSCEHCKVYDGVDPEQQI